VLHSAIVVIALVCAVTAPPIAAPVVELVNTLVGDVTDVDGINVA
jgi:hypothetical protein